MIKVSASFSRLAVFACSSLFNLLPNAYKHTYDGHYSLHIINGPQQSHCHSHCKFKLKMDNWHNCNIHHKHSNHASSIGGTLKCLTTY